MKFNIHLRSTFKLWNRNVETYKFMSTFESASEEIVCTPWMSLFVWACLSDAAGEKSKWLWPEYVSRLCVADISHGHANVQNLYLFFILFCAQKSRLYEYFGQQYIENEFLFLYHVQSTSIQPKSSTPFYNVIFITFDVYYKNYTNTAHSHTYHKRNHEPKKQIQTLYIFVNQIITSQLLAALLLLSMLLEKNVWTNVFLMMSLLSGRSKQKNTWRLTFTTIIKGSTVRSTLCRSNKNP